MMEEKFKQNEIRLPLPGQSQQSPPIIEKKEHPNRDKNQQPKPDYIRHACAWI
jgi:hypothetical protein